MIARPSPSGLPLPVGTLLAMMALTAPACGDDDYERTSRRGAPQPMGAVATNLKDVGKPSVEVQQELAERKKPRKKRPSSRGGVPAGLPQPDEFTERDFAPSPQESRDPFRNYQFKDPLKAAEEVMRTGDVVYLKDYPLSELKLTGIVGSRRRFAMVQDPRTRRATIIKARDRIGREQALVFQVEPDHLVLLVPRQRPEEGEPYERMTLYVDETRKIVGIGSEALRPDESGIRISRGRRY